MSIRRLLQLAARLGFALLGLASTTSAQQPTLERFVVSGDGVTYARGIDAQGGVAGSYTLPDLSNHAYLRDSSGALQLVDWPGGSMTFFEGLTDAGVALGFAVGPGSSGPVEFQSGVWTALVPPPMASVFLQGGNDNGLRVGHLIGSDAVHHGVLFTNGVATTLDFPGAIDTELEDVNASGLMVGNYRPDANSGWHGFTYDLNTATFRTLDMPGMAWSLLKGLNESGDIVGQALPMGGGERRAVLFSSGQWSELDLFGVIGDSLASDINNAGTICGDYYGQFNGAPTVVGYIHDPNGSGPTRQCQALPNSSGEAADIHYVGTTSIAANDLVLEAGPAPANQSGLFFYGQNPVQVPFGDGFKCVGAPQYRLAVGITDAQGFAFHAFDSSAPPSAGGQVTAGSRWYFQHWFRDPAAGASGFNTSRSLVVDFTP
jgi:hypothetical protein